MGAGGKFTVARRHCTILDVFNLVHILFIRSFIHNKDIASTLLVVNESKLSRSAVNPPLPSIDTTITVRYCDVDKVASIEEAATAWMKTHPDVFISLNMSCRCSLQGFDVRGPVLAIKATLKRDAIPRKSKVTTEVLLKIERIVREHGAFLAVKEGVELPPSLSSINAGPVVSS